MYINVAEEISGIPSSWPGYDLDIGASGSKVLQLQEQLNAISQAYPALPKVNLDGIYGAQTQASVRKFQNIFGSPGNRNRRLCHLVQNSGNLRRRHPDCRITVNTIWRDFSLPP